MIAPHFGLQGLPGECRGSSPYNIHIPMTPPLCCKYINKKVLFDNSFSSNVIPGLAGHGAPIVTFRLFRVNPVVLLPLHPLREAPCAQPALDLIGGGNLCRHAGEGRHSVPLFFVFRIKKY